MKKVKVSYQTLQNECGSCCIAMIMNYYKCNMSVDAISAEIEAGRDGISFIQMKNFFILHNFDAKVYSCAMEGIELLPLPAIALWGENHYVVIEKVGSKAIKVIDPISGRQSYGLEEFKNNFKSYILIIKSQNKRQSRNYKTPVVLKYFKISNYKKDVLGISIFAIFSYCITLMLPMSIENIVNGLSGIPNNNYIILGSLSFILIFFGINIISGKLNISYGKKLYYSINDSFVNKIIKLPYKYFLLHTSGDILFKVNCTSIIEGIYTNQILPMILDGSVICILLVYAFITSFYLSTVLLIIMITIGIFTMLLLYNINHVIRRTLRENNKLNSQLVEMVSVMETIKTTNMGNDIYARWKKSFISALNENLKYDNLTNIYNALTNTFSIACPFFLLFLGFGLKEQLDIPLGTLLGFYTTSTIAFAKETNLFSNINQYIVSVNYFSKVDEVLEQKEERHGTKRIEGEISVKFCNVFYQYSRYSTYILKNINMDIVAGKMVAIVGASGSGKSTISKLIYGLLKPTKGNIYINNIDIKNIDLIDFRGSVGVVPQKIELFNMSIYDNIVLGDNSITIERVKEICNIVEIDDDIENMPMKYNTILNNNGNDLSGGQKQRLAIAQALIKSPKLLIMDEATSYLDAINEKKISDKLEEIGCTRIVIAHRLSTVKNADYIYVIEKGEIVEKGIHEELMSNNYIYTKLYSENGLINNQII